MRFFLGFILLSVFAASSPLFGQAEQQPIRFSAKVAAGFSTSQIHGDQISGFNQFGGTFGALLDMRRSATRGSELGIIWTQKGSRRPPDPKNDDYTTWQYRFSYIDVPLLRIWQPNDAGWWFGFGIQPSILLGKGQEDFDGNGFRDIQSFILKPIDLGGVGVLGIHASDHWDIEVRLAQSLLPISPRPEQTVQGFNSFMMNLAIQWMLAWRF
jgi:hypothetical protein